MGYREKLSSLVKKLAGSYSIKLTKEELQDLKFFSDRGNDCGLLNSLSKVNEVTGEYVISEESREKILSSCEDYNAWQDLNWQSSLGIKISKLFEQLKGSSTSSISEANIVSPNSLSPASKDLGHPPTPITRQVDPLYNTTNLGPQGDSYDRPYMRTEMQDTIKKWANMKPELVQKLSMVADNLERVAFNRDAKVDLALEKIQASLLHHGYKDTNPLMRKLVKLQKSYDLKLAQDIVALLIKRKFSNTDPTLMQARLVVDLINRHNVDMLPSPQEVTNEKVANETLTDLKQVADLCKSLVGKLKRLKLAEETNQLKVMISSANDIYETVKKLNA